MIQRMPVAKLNVFNIPASAPFLPVLIDALRAGKLAVSYTHLTLPTKRIV